MGFGRKASMPATAVLDIFRGGRSTSAVTASTDVRRSPGCLCRIAAAASETIQLRHVDIHPHEVKGLSRHAVEDLAAVEDGCEQYGRAVREAWSTDAG